MPTRDAGKQQPQSREQSREPEKPRPAKRDPKVARDALTHTPQVIAKPNKPKSFASRAGEPVRSGRCAILGRPNVGKSTLLNAMVGQKLAIATHKPQTTRTALLGVCVRTQPPLQIAFVDTPGLHRPASALGRALVESARGELQHCDVVLLVVTAGKNAELSETIGESERELLTTLKHAGDKAQPVVLALNKVDQIKQKHLLLPLIEKLMTLYPFSCVVPTSALRGINVEELIVEVGTRLPEGLVYDKDLLTDKPEKFFAAELVREALIRNTRHEVPHAAAVTIDAFSDDVKVTRISATIVVEKDAHKGIVIGKSGSMLKTIGTEARLEMEAMFGRKVFLELWVKVVEDWTDNARRVREILDADTGSAQQSDLTQARAAAAHAMSQLAASDLAAGDLAASKLAASKSES